MSLKCSLLGHRFDESAVEHDREEDGSEVVIVTTELEACSRCGETRVVSENKEVRTTESPEADADADADAETETAGDDEAADVSVAGAADDESDGVTDDAAETDTTAESTGTELIDEAGPGETAGDAGAPDEDVTASAVSDTETSPEDGSAEADDVDGDDTTDPAQEDAEILGSDDAGTGDADAEGDAQAQARSEPTEIPDAEADASVADVGGDSDGEVTDDAVIIDGDSGDDREPGEWPEEQPADETDAGEPADEGDEGDEATDVEEIDDDSVVWSGESDDERGEAQSGSADAEWPEEEAEAREGDDGPLGEWPEETMPDGTDDEETGPTLEQAASPTVTVPEGMYKCSECGFTADVESSPHRAGDFCPECHHGTLVQDEGGGN